MNEIARQIVHISGIVLVILSFFIDSILISAYFFSIAISLLIYSLIFTKQRNNLIRALHTLENGFNFLVDKFERTTTKKPFIGAIWFYFSCGLAFLFFPFKVAVITCSILAVADGFSTIIGTNFGRHKLIGRKSVEGSLVFFITSFLVLLIISSLWNIGLWIILSTSIMATLSELLPELRVLKKAKEREIIDDNFTIVAITGLFLMFTL